MLKQDSICLHYIYMSVSIYGSKRHTQGRKSPLIKRKRKKKKAETNDSHSRYGRGWQIPRSFKSLKRHMSVTLRPYCLSIQETTERPETQALQWKCFLEWKRFKDAGVTITNETLGGCGGFQDYLPDALSKTALLLFFYYYSFLFHI